MDKPQRSASESPEEQPRKIQKTGVDEEIAGSGEESNSSASLASGSGSDGSLGLGSVSSGSSDDIIFQVNTNSDSYTTDRQLGSGTYGTVYRAVRHSDDLFVAIKLLDHTNANANNIQYEVNMTRFIQENPHTNVMTIYEIHVTASSTFLIGEYSDIGDIYEAMQIDNGMGHTIWVQLDENQSRYLAVGIARGLRHLHGLGIAHGDLKLNNVLLFPNADADQYPQHPSITTIDRWTPKLCDFSNSQRGVNPSAPIMHNRPLCAVAYAAPESYEGIQYDCVIADVFSLGCCLIAMIMGAVPFNPPIEQPSDSVDSIDRAEHQQNVNTFSVKSKYEIGYKDSLFRICSKPLRNLLEALLEANPQNRITLDQFFAHEWVTRPKSREFEDVSGKVSYMTTHPLIPGIQIKTYAADN